MAIKLTTKKRLVGCNVSHSNIHTKRAQKANVQQYTINGIKVLLTPREYRAIKKNA